MEDKLRLNAQRLLYKLVSHLGRYRRVGLPVQQLLVRALGYATQNKLGLHIERLTGQILDYIEQWQPAVVVWVGPNWEGIDAIRERSPSTFIVIRKYEEGRDWQTTDPRWWADQIIAMVTDGSGVVHKPDGAILWNEPFGHDSSNLFAPFDDWEVACHQRLKEHGVEGVFFNFGTGNFNKGDPDLIRRAFPKSCDVGKYFGIHEYYWPSMFDERAIGWHTVRWPYWMQAIGRDNTQVIVTECGLTQCVHEGRPDVGYRTYEDGVNDDTYLWDLNQYNAKLVEDPKVIGAAIFDWGNWSWPTFEHEDKPELVQRIISISAPEPPQPNGGDKMSLEKIKVFKMNPSGAGHIELVTLADKEALVYGKYGAAFRRAQVASGQKVYRLVEIWEKTGHSSLITNVVDENGNPMADVVVTFYWPDAPKPPDPPTPVYDHDWYDRFKHGPTNINGDVGPGMGKGAYHGQGEGGPHAVWIHDPNIPSDICEKLGMLAGTFHDHLDQKFQLVTGDGPDDRWFYEVGEREEEASDDNHIVITATGDDTSFYETRLNLCVGDDPSNPDWEAPNPIHPTSMETYDVEANYVPTEGEERRTFWARIDTPDGTPLSDWLPFEFETGEHKTIVAYVAYEEEEPPPPLPSRWTMTTEAKSGISLLIGKMPRAGIRVAVTDPGNHEVVVVSGSKAADHGVGGWEINAYAHGVYAIEFEDQRFQVAVEGQTVTATFEEDTEPEPEQARLVSTWMDKADAESMLQDLEQQYPGKFSLET